MTSVDAIPPSVPTNLAGNPVSMTQVNLTWTESTDNVAVAGYNVYRDMVLIGSTAGVAYNDTTCAPGTAYSYQVAAYDTAGNESALSAAANVTTPMDTEAPSIPMNLAGTAISETRVDLTWTASTDNIGVTGYKVFRDDVQIGTSATTAYSDTTCTINTTYMYKVSAYDAIGNESARSTAAEVTTLGNDTEAPTVPANLQATAVSATQVDLAWEGSTDNVGVTGYRIFRDNVEIATSALTTYSDTTCAEYTAYTYEVSAYDASSNESARSAAANVTTLDVTAPGIPANLAATAVSGTQVDLIWTASTDNVAVTGYKVFRDSVQIGTSATASYSDTTCSPATTYTYEVSAYDAASNESAKSAPDQATTPDTVAPSVPTNLNATAVSGTQVDLTWTASTDNVAVTGYKVFRDSVQIGTSATASYSDTTCSPATTYTYEVSAYDAATNELAKSAPDQATTPDTIAPTVPTNLGTTVISGTQIDLSWTGSTDNVGVTGYKVYRNSVQIGTSATPSYSDTTCSPATTYTYEVAAYDAASNESAKSAPAQGTTPDTIAPSAPTNLVGTPIASTRIDLSWTASSDNVGVTGYKVFRNSVQIGTSGTTSYSDTTCSPNVTYTYEVSAYDAAQNNSGLSNAVQVATVANTDIIMDNTSATYAGSWFTGTAATNKYGADYRYITTQATETGTATWTPTIDVAGYYNVYCWYPHGGNRSAIAPYTIQWDGSSQTVAVNQQINGGVWVALVSAKRFQAGTAGYARVGNGTGEVALSVMADAVRFLLVSDDLTAPSVPTDLAANAVSSSQIDLTWTASTDNVGVSGYRIFRDNVEIGTSATTSYSSTGLSGGTLYTYKVTAYDAMGNESAQSAPASATTWDGIPPTVPTGVAASAVGPQRINISWTASTDNVGVTGYKVFRNGGYVGSSATTSYSDGGLAPNTGYTYTVSAYDAATNESAQSTGAGATTPGYQETIIDNPGCTWTGVWTTSTSGTTKYGADYKYASTAVSEGKTARWTPTIAYGGNYDIYAWWTAGSNRATNSPFFVQWNGGSQTVSTNQSTNGGAWRVLLTGKNFAAGTASYLKLGNGTGATGKVVVADAARFVQVSGD